MKRTYSLTLDINDSELVRKWCKHMGMTFSGFVNAFLGEVANDLRGENAWMNKPIGDVTLKEFGEGLATWMKRMKELEGQGEGKDQVAEG